MFPLLIVVIAIGYLLGALPFGFLVARAKGVNIFEVGSKNPGATNVRRVLGAGPGNLVLILDALKGALASGWPLVYASLRPGTAPGSDEILTIAGVVSAILGHSFSCFTGFRGGKSVATGAGGFFVVFPYGMLIALGLFLATLGLSRFVSLSSMLGAVSLPVSAIVFHRSTMLVSVTAVIALFVILRHRTNLSRLIAGTESKVGRKPAPVPLSSAAPKS